MASSAIAAIFDRNEAEICRQLCADSYCNYDHYMTHVYEGFATGFEPTYVIYEQTNDT